MTADGFLIVNQIPKIFWEESQQVFFEKVGTAPADAKDPKKKDAAAAPEEGDEPPVPIPYLHENSILIDKAFSDAPEKLKSVPDVILELGEHVYYLEKSNLSIFRFEDVLYTVFPHLASLKRKFANTKEIFQKNDPF